MSYVGRHVHFWDVLFCGSFSSRKWVYHTIPYQSAPKAYCSYHIRHVSNINNMTREQQWVVEDWSPRPPLTAAPSVEGRHVRLDPLDVTTDVPLLWQALGGHNGTINDLVYWWGVGELRTEAKLATLLREQIEQPGGVVNVIRLLPSRQVAGMASYIQTRPAHGVTECGFVVHGDALRQTVAATEAHYLLASHVLDTLQYRRYEWKCDSLNAPSNRAAQRYGFTYEGTFRQVVVTARGHNRDTNWYAMVDKDWPRIKAAWEAWLDPSNFERNGQTLLQKRKLQEFHDMYKNKKNNFRATKDS